MYVGPAGAALSSQVQEVLPLPLVGHSGGGEGGGGEGGGGTRQFAALSVWGW